MTRRLFWLGVGAAAGSGATVWARQRVDRLARRMQQPGQLGGELVTLVDHGARTTVTHVRRSIDSGRTAARRRSSELQRELERRDSGH
jgi:hypothetical protein